MPTSATPPWKIGTTANPVPITGILLYKPTDIADFAINSSSMFDWTSFNGNVLGLFTCNLSIFDLDFTCQEGSCGTSNTKLADGDTTSALTGALGIGMVTDPVVSYLVQFFAGGLIPNMNFNELFGTELARQSLAFSAGLLVRTNTTAPVSAPRTIIASRYAFAPFGIFVLLLGMNAFLALGIFAWAWTARSPYIALQSPDKRIPALVLVHKHLTSADALVAALSASRGHAPLDPFWSVSESPADLFGESRNAAREMPRLGIGIDGKGDEFGLLEFTDENSLRRSSENLLSTYVGHEINPQEKA
jgi:hypothetical protein